MSTELTPGDVWQARLRLVAGSRCLIAFSQDVDLRYTWVYRSPAAGDGGLALDSDAVGRTDAEVLPFGDSSRLTHHKQRALTSGQPYSFPFRTWVRGAHFEYAVSLEPLKDAAGCVVGVLGVAEDVTDARQAAADAAQALAAAERRAEGAICEARERAKMERTAFSAAVSVALAASSGLRLCANADDLPERLPAAPGDAGEATRLLPASLRELRRRAFDAALLVGIAEGRALDLMTAVGEIGMNAVRHAEDGEGRAYCDAETGAVQVWITDRRLAEPPSPPALDGWRWQPRRGLRLALLTADRLHLHAGPEGTTVVVEKRRDPPEPAGDLDLV